jgi:hypothetical protein
MTPARRSPMACAFLAMQLLIFSPLVAAAQSPAPGDLRPTVPELGMPGGATPDPAAPELSGPEPPPAIDPNDNTTVIPRTTGDVAVPGPAPSSPDQLQLVALLTVDGQRIDQGLTWRVYAPLQQQGKVKLLSTHTEASPTIKLKPGEYVVNAAFGRAHLTRRITMKPDATEPTIERFVLNAGGLRVSALAGTTELPANQVRYTIFSDRDQLDNRRTIMAGAKPGVVVRLNAGIYQVESTYGDANATVRADVTVEAGKLTEAVVKHASARATFKLVSRAGGEAIADTQWHIETRDGQTVKDNYGAFFTHIMAPGAYTVFAKHGGKSYRREFALEDAGQQEIEVLVE